MGLMQIYDVDGQPHPSLHRVVPKGSANSKMDMRVAADTLNICEE